MASVGEIRDGIQARLLTITGLRAFDLVQGKIPTPCAWVRPLTHERDTQDADRWTFAIDLYVSMNSLRAAQDNLDAYLPGGAKDVRAAVESDPDLADTVDSAVCSFVDGSYGIKEVNLTGDLVGTLFLGCEFEVEVYV